MTLSHADCVARDRADSLAYARKRFSVPENVVYLDGNSLGALPVATISRLNETLQREWGEGLIRSWNNADWVTLPQRVGAAIAGLLGASADEIVAADSTSVNIFKLLAGALALASKQDPARRVILSERGNFPTDLYVAQGIVESFGGGYKLRLVDGDIENAFDDHTAIALITQVDYCTGRLHNMKRLNDAARRAGTR